MKLRRIITPSARDHTIILPKEYYGKRVVVTVTAFKEPPQDSNDDFGKEEEARVFFNSIRVDMTEFKFDREKANER